MLETIAKETSSYATLHETLQPQSTQLAEPLWTDPGLKSGIGECELISTLKKRKKSAIIEPPPRIVTSGEKASTTAIPSVAPGVCLLFPQLCIPTALLYGPTSLNTSPTFCAVGTQSCGNIELWDHRAMGTWSRPRSIQTLEIDNS